MADNTTSTPNHASSWGQLSVDFKNFGINEVKDYADFLVACYKSKGKLQLDDWDLVEKHIKDSEGQTPNATSEAKEAPKEAPKDSTSPETKGFWTQSITARGEKADFFSEDRRIAALELIMQNSWGAVHQNDADFLSKAAELFQNVTLDKSDEFARWTTNFIAAESVAKTKAKHALKILDEKAFANYEEAEKTHVYDLMHNDPAYVQVLLDAKERTRDFYNRVKEQNRPDAQMQVDVFFANEKLKGFYEFAKKYPEKTKAYSKNKGNLLMLQAASLQRPPDATDLFTVIRTQTLEVTATPSARRGVVRFINAKIMVMERQAETDPARKAKLEEQIATYRQMAERIQQAPDDTVDAEISKAQTVLASIPAAIYDAAVLQKILPQAQPPATPADIAAAAATGETINLKGSLRAIPSSSGMDGGENAFDGEGEDGEGDDFDDEGDEDEEDEESGEDEQGEGENGEEENQDDESGNKKRKKSRFEDENSLRKSRERYNKLRRGGKAVKRGANAVKNVAKNAAKKAASALEKQAINAGRQVLMRLMMTPHFWIVVGVILLIILVVAILLYLFSGSDEGMDDKLPQVSITKTGPAFVANGEKVPYTINVQYPGIATNVIVSDEIPPGTRLIEAETTQPFTYNPVDRVVTWSLKDLQLGGAGGFVTGAKEFPQDKFQEYGFPPPEEDGATMPGETVTKWQNGMMEHAVRAGQLTGVDVGILGMWPWYEGINYNNYYDNCNDPNSRPYLSDADYDGNTPCPYLNWQVGYGVRPMETLNYLKEAMDSMYPGRTIQEVGQRVIDRSKGSDNEITYPESTFPNITIDDILSGAEQGIGPDAGKEDRRYRPSDSAQKMRGWAAILMKDEAISTYVLAKVFQGRIGPSLADIMEGWSAYYNRQRVINYIYAVYKAGIGGDGTIFLPQTITLTVLPEKNDTYIFNQATAHVLGARIEGEEKPTLPDPENAAPNDDNCTGFYTFFYMPDGSQKNFGDPLCSLRLVNDDGTVVVNQEKIAAKLKEIDEDDAQIWMTVVIPCMSQMQPNNWVADDTELGRWGLFGMGSTTPPFGSGNGPNGTHDRGDVIWVKQIINAVNYNKDLEGRTDDKGRSQKWQYWPEQCRPK